MSILGLQRRQNGLEDLALGRLAVRLCAEMKLSFEEPQANHLHRLHLEPADLAEDPVEEPLREIVAAAADEDAGECLRAIRGDRAPAIHARKHVTIPPSPGR